MSDDFCRTVSEEHFSFSGCKDPFLVLYYPEVFAHSPTYAPYPSLLLGPFAELPVHHIIGLSERLTGCAVAIVVAPSGDFRVDFPYEFALGVYPHLSDDRADLFQMPAHLVLFRLNECLEFSFQGSPVLPTVEAEKVESRFIAFICSQGMHYSGFLRFELQSHPA